MTIRRLALAAAAIAAACMFALSLPVHADSHEEAEVTEEAAEKEHEEKEESREAEHENGDEHEEAEHENGDSRDEKADKAGKKLHKSDSPEAKRDRGPSPEAMRDRRSFSEAIRERARFLSDLYGGGDEDEDEMRRRGEMVEGIRERLESLEGIRERLESLRRVPIEHLRQRLIEQTRRAVREKIEKSPEEAHEIEMGGEKYIQEIEKMPEEKLRAVFMDKMAEDHMAERLRKSMGETDMRKKDMPNRRRAMMSMRKNRTGGTERWNMSRRVNINRMNRQTDAGDMRFEAFHLEHIPAQHAAEMIDPFMPRNTRIAADPRTNKLLVMTSGHGMRIAMTVLGEVDVPVDGERDEAEESRRRRQQEADEADEAEENRRRRRSDEEMEREGDRRSGALPMPRYDYEGRRQIAPRDPRANWPVGGDIFNPYMPANRIEGMLTEKGDGYIAVQIEGVDEQIRARLPVVRVGDAWTVKGNLANKLKELDPGDAVIFEWWEAEGVLYLQNIARLEENRRERIETYLFE